MVALNVFGSDKEDNAGLVECIALEYFLAYGRLVEFTWDRWWKRGDDIASGDRVGVGSIMVGFN